MKSRFWLLPSAAMALAVLVAVPAQAATWEFAFSSTDGGTYSGSGTFVTGSTSTTNDFGASANEITSISGSFSAFSVAGTIDSIAASGETSDFDYNNLFSSVAPYFDDLGIVFLASNGVYYNLFYDGTDYELVGSDSTYYSPTITFSELKEVTDTTPPTAVPEPSTLVLMLAAAGLIASTRKRLQR